MSRPHRARGLLVAASLAFVGATSLASGTASAAPGEIVSARQVPLRLGGLEHLAPARAWRLEYESTSARGNAIVATALVAVPRKQAAGRPLVGKGHGTEGFGDACAPSTNYSRGTALEAPTLAGLLYRGWTVVVADGEGLGSPGDPAYMVGQSAGRTMLDALRAARSLSAAGLPADGPTGLFGYSEGGATSVWANELQPTYAPDVNLRGAVAGGTPADLLDAADSLNGSLFAAFLFQAAMGLDAAYPELDLPSYVNARGAALLPAAKRACLFEALALGAFRTIEQLVTTNPLSQPDWRARIAENQPGQQAPGSPVYFYHGRQDEILPFTSVEALHQRYCQLGANSTLQVYNQSHFATYAAGAQTAMNWLSARLSGSTPASSC